jgi:ribosomal protein L15
VKGFFNPTRENLKEISLRELGGKIAAGEFKPDAQGVYSINLEGFKILSSGSVKAKLAIRAAGFSKKAVEKITAAGGTVNTA